MIQKTYHIHDFNEEKLQAVLSEAASLSAYNTASQVLVTVMEQNWDAKKIKRKTDMIRRMLPKAEIAGITHFDEVLLDGNIPESTLLSILFFESATVQSYRFDLEENTDAEIGAAVNSWLCTLPDVKGLLVFFSKSDRDVGMLLHTAESGLEDIPIFGADAGHGDVFGENSFGYVFDQDGCCRNALLACAFCGEGLEIRADCNFGWNPVGKTFAVTELEDPYTVAKIDGRPAAELYRRYLGIPYDSNELVMANICEFPLVTERYGMRMGRIPSAWTREGALRLHVTMHLGEQLRFSYGRPQQIFSQVCENARAFREFGAQGMFMIVCMNRMIFLHEQEHLETDAYRRVVPGAVFMHGNSEIYRNHGAGGEMHSALIAVGFREGSAHMSAEDAAEDVCPLEALSKLIPLELRLTTFLRAVTTDLEETTEELLQLKEHLEDEVERKSRENEGLSLHVVQTLAEAIDAKDSYTNGHSGRVARYSREIARRAGYSEKAQNDIYMMGLLHDVGKIGVPDAVINKPGRLTDEEFGQIKNHPVMGSRILTTIKEMPMLATGARWHHERYDGRGYPDALSGTDIPEEARIIGVADAYDAMTSNRSYRRSLEQSVVRERIEEGKGTQFDPRFADIMLQMIDEDKDYTMREIVP